MPHIWTNAPESVRHDATKQDPVAAWLLLNACETTTERHG
jgi:hypothetical protein